MATRPATEPRSTLHAFRDALEARSDDATVRIRDLGPLTQVGLRADAADAERLADAVGVALPARPNTVARGDGSRRALWLGPDEWLLVDEPGGGDALVAGVEEAAGVRWATAVDLSANRVVSSSPARASASCWRRAARSTSTRARSALTAARRRCSRAPR